MNIFFTGLLYKNLVHIPNFYSLGMRNFQYEIRICQKSHNPVTITVFVWFEFLWKGVYKEVHDLLYLYRSVYPQTGWNSDFSTFWTNSIFPLFSPLIVLRSQVLVLPRNRLPDRGDCTENNPSVCLHRYIQKHRKIGGTVTHSSNCLEPEKRGEM